MQPSILSDEETNLNLDDTTEIFTLDASLNLAIAIFIIIFVPIIIWMISRLKKIQKQRKISDRAKNYDYCIIIGTHQIRYWVCEKGQLIPASEKSLQSV